MPYSWVADPRRDLGGLSVGSRMQMLALDVACVSWFSGAQGSSLHLEPVDAGKLNIEQHQLRPQPLRSVRATCRNPSWSSTIRTVSGTE